MGQLSLYVQLLIDPRGMQSQMIIHGHCLMQGVGCIVYEQVVHAEKRLHGDAGGMLLQTVLHFST